MYISIGFTSQSTQENDQSESKLFYFSHCNKMFQFTSFTDTFEELLSKINYLNTFDSISSIRWFQVKHTLSIVISNK